MSQLLGSFLTAATDFSKTWITGSSNSSYTNITGVIQVDELRNPDTQAGFYVVRHANSSSVNTTAFALTLSVWNGNVTVPVTLNGRVSLQKCIAFHSWIGFAHHRVQLLLRRILLVVLVGFGHDIYHDRRG